MTRFNTIRLAASAALTIAASVGIWLCNSFPAFAAPPGTAPPSARCLAAENNGDTGCKAKYCTWYAPNTGITWSATWECCYDAGHNLVRADKYVCTDFENGGCCNDLDADPDCPNMVCQQSY